MADTQSDLYKLKGRSRNVSSLEEQELPGENIFSRNCIKIDLINHFEDPSRFAGIHLEIIHQKKQKKSDPWPIQNVRLDDSAFKGKSLRIKLDTKQSLKLFELLQDAYAIAKNGIEEGSRTVLKNVNPEEILVTDKNRVAVFKRILDSSSSEEVLDLLKHGLPDDIRKKFAFNKVYEERLSVVKEFEKNIDLEKGEEYWQKLFKRNKWIFGSSYIQIIDERRIDIHHEADFPLAVDGGFIDIAEIKKPDLNFWHKNRDGSINYLYRGKYLIPSLELQGAISQCSKYIYQAEKKVDSVDYRLDHGGMIPLKPRGIIIHGRSRGWGELERESFRLLNDDHHSLEIITFDHLLNRAKNALKVFSEEQS